MRIFQKTIGFGLHIQMHIPARSFLHLIQLNSYANHIFGPTGQCFSLIFFRIEPMFVGNRGSGNTTFHTFGCQNIQLFEQPQGILQTFLCGPIRYMHLILYRFAMKIPIGKTVHGEYVAIFLIQPFLKFLEMPLVEFQTGSVSQTKSQSKRFIRTNSTLDLGHIFL